MIDLLKQHYEGKKIFITGHTGFKGAWLLKTLSLLGATIKGYALETKNENDLYNLIEGDRLCNSIIADLRNRERLIDEIVQFQPDFIFHLAAQPLVRLSYEIPSETFEVNAIGTANLLDAVKCLDKKCSVVLITTDKVYHNNEWEYAYRENDILGGHDPYSASKACAELIINSYRNSFFHPENYEKHLKGIAVCRAGNVIGGGDWSKDRLIPDIAKSLLTNKKILIRNPKSVRPWQHVLEPVIAYLLLGVHLEGDAQKYGQAYNFGPFGADALAVDEMVNLAINAWGGGEYENLVKYDQPHEAGMLKLDISKAIADLKWMPLLNAEDAIRYTIKWYKEFAGNKGKMALYTEEQILNYLSKYK